MRTGASFQTRRKLAESESAGGVGIAGRVLAIGLFVGRRAGRVVALGALVGPARLVALGARRRALRVATGPFLLLAGVLGVVVGVVVGGHGFRPTQVGAEPGGGAVGGAGACGAQRRRWSRGAAWSVGI